MNEPSESVASVNWPTPGPRAESTARPAGDVDLDALAAAAGKSALEQAIVPLVAAGRHFQDAVADALVQLASVAVNERADRAGTRDTLAGATLHYLPVDAPIPLRVVVEPHLSPRDEDRLRQAVDDFNAGR